MIELMTSSRSRCRRRANTRVDLDPVISHLRMHYLAGSLGHNDIGLLSRHVAVDALALNPGLTQLF